MSIPNLGAMRAVAERVGVSTMSVYTYVPGKAELLDLMVDRLYRDMPRPPWRIRTWRRRLERVAERNRALFADHPWLTEVVVLSRPPLGPGVMAKYEHEGSPYYSTARLWDDGILDPLETRQALALGLSAAVNAPHSPPSYGVFRM